MQSGHQPGASLIKSGSLYLILIDIFWSNCLEQNLPVTSWPRCGWAIAQEPLLGPG